MSSTRRGCTSECFYSTSPASTCKCACGGEYHGQGAQATSAPAQVQTVGGQSFIPATGSDSRPAEHTPEQQAELDRNAEIAALDAEATDAEQEAQDLRRRAGEHIDQSSAMAAHLRTGATAADNRAKAARRKARELRGEPELESERITREAFARGSVTAEDLRASREAQAREAARAQADANMATALRMDRERQERIAAREAQADNTLAWNPKTRKVEGTYRGHTMVAGRGTAYQFQVGDKVQTGYWTGVIREDGTPEFRDVDTGHLCVTPRDAAWFSPLSEVTPTPPAPAPTHPLAGSPEGWTDRTFTLDNFTALDGDDRRVNLPAGRYTVEAFTPNPHMPEGGLVTLRSAEGGPSYRIPAGTMRGRYDDSLRRRAGQNVVEWEIAEAERPGSGGNLADQIALGNHATNPDSPVRQAAVRAVTDRLDGRVAHTGAMIGHTNAQARLLVTGGRTSSADETTVIEESLALDAARAYLDQHGTARR